MQRAIQLALLGLGNVAPNPMVGCVIVHNDTIIGEGWHKEYGKAHAEVNAIESVINQDLLKESTVYVSLEPCSHYGKTPPCADLLITKQVKKVVVANLDTNPLVAGKGLEKLKNAGIEIETSILEKEARLLNKRFFTFMEKRRPYILLKWAETSDGFVARKNYDSKWISNEHSRTLVHKWRTEEQAIMVGTNTALYDNPQLNVRDWSGKNPIRIVIDKNLKLPHHFYLFDQTQKTICYNLVKNEENHNLALVRLDADNFLENLLQDLFERKVQSVLVEGGSFLINKFIEKNYWDEARIFVASQTFQEGIVAPNLCKKSFYIEDIQGDTLFYYSNFS
jgi:diaminohydroxyphosphoribosylaminopyrimidine deaminase / 5-amino-6-(5-phosphoribosylamino)uracil reductase